MTSVAGFYSEDRRSPLARTSSNISAMCVERFRIYGTPVLGSLFLGTTEPISISSGFLDSWASSLITRLKGCL